LPLAGNADRNGSRSATHSRNSCPAGRLGASAGVPGGTADRRDTVFGEGLATLADAPGIQRAAHRVRPEERLGEAPRLPTTRSLCVISQCNTLETCGPRPRVCYWLGGCSLQYPHVSDARGM